MDGVKCFTWKVGVVVGDVSYAIHVIYDPQKPSPFWSSVLWSEMLAFHHFKQINSAHKYLILGSLDVIWVISYPNSSWQDWCRFFDRNTSPEIPTESWRTWVDSGPFPKANIRKKLTLFCYTRCTIILITQTIFGVYNEGTSVRMKSGKTTAN